MPERPITFDGREKIFVWVEEERRRGEHIRIIHHLAGDMIIVRIDDDIEPLFLTWEFHPGQERQEILVTSQKALDMLEEKGIIEPLPLSGKQASDARAMVAGTD